jgi:hypothetical protein
MPTERLRHLELDTALPSTVKSAVGLMGRFDNLEIAGAPVAPPPPAIGRVPCHHCGQANEPTTEHCWACRRCVRGKDEDAGKVRQPFSILLNGKTVHSEDPTLPPLVRRLIEDIRRDGVTPADASEWVRRQEKALPSTLGSAGVVAVKIDGRLHRSDDPATPPELRTLMDHVARHGITPELMEDLRRQGHKVKFRPTTTLAPTDGDENFWRDERVQDIANAPTDPDGRYPLWFIGLLIVTALALAKLAGSLVSRWIRSS